MTQLTRLETVIPGLHATTPEPLPFATSLHVRAFVLERDRGNILVYSTAGLEADAAAIEDLGGLARHYLNHRHEAMFASDAVHAPLFVHENDRDSVARAYHVRGTFSRRHVLDDDFEVIPTPGHTSGATAYLWDSGGHRALFTGDTIFLSRGERPRLQSGKPRAHPRARLRRARALGGQCRRALPRRHQPRGRAAPHRRDHRARASRGAALTGPARPVPALTRAPRPAIGFRGWRDSSA
jgi:glyoxylase-like metal-dependent hydrolase (beta-lactamase superfamily II)